MFSNLFSYLKGVREELNEVEWPTRDEAVRFTMIVIGFSLVFALFLGLSDFMFARAINMVIDKF